MPVIEAPDEPKAELSDENASVGTNVRVRILETLSEPILDDAGEALTLEVGDVHVLDEATASWLIDAGVAERAEL
jgi:hypothetical protein